MKEKEKTRYLISQVYLDQLTILPLLKTLL
jgi:hypothetical protein